MDHKREKWEKKLKLITIYGVAQNKTVFVLSF